MAHSSAPLSGVNSSSLVTVNALSDGLVSVEYLIVFEGLSCFISLEIFTLHLSSQLHEGIFTPLQESSDAGLHPDDQQKLLHTLR